MRIAGGVLAILAGVFGALAGFMEVFLGLVTDELSKGSSGEEYDSFTIKLMGYFGIGASVAILVLGVVVFLVRGRAAGIALIVLSIVGGIFGGTFVAACLALSLIGGILAILAHQTVPPPPLSYAPGAWPPSPPYGPPPLPLPDAPR